MDCDTHYLLKFRSRVKMVEKQCLNLRVKSLVWVGWSESEEVSVGTSRTVY